MPRLAARLGRWLALSTALWLTAACGGKADAPPTGVQPTVITNLLRNAGLDTAGAAAAPAGWTRRSTGSPAPTFSYPVAGRTGQAAAVTLAARSSGEARWQHESIAITAGSQYTVSFWYKSTTTSKVSVEYTTPGGSSTFDQLDSLPSTDNAWKQYTTTFTTPALRTRMSVYHWINTPGTLTIDDAWLAVGRNGPPSSGQPPADTTTPPRDTTPVTPPPAAPAITITASPAAILTGQTSTITWTSTNATACTASGAWSGTKALAGNEVVTPTSVGSFSHTLTCTGAGGTTLRSTVITVTAPPPPAFTEGLVTFTLDDAFETQYVNALPILEAAGFKATFFIPSAPLQQGWNLFMTPAMVLDMAGKGHEIGGHTITHPDLTVLTPAAVTSELADSRTYLRALTGQAVASFAFPFGRSNAAVREQVRQAGFTSARGVNYDTQNTLATDEYNLRAMCVDTSMTIESIKAQILAAKTNRTWFILCLHDIRIGGDELSMTPARLQELVDYVRQERIRVVTMAQGRALMQK